MQLEMRSAKIARKKTPALRFRLFFSFDEQVPPCNWRELELEWSSSGLESVAIVAALGVLEYWT